MVGTRKIKAEWTIEMAQDLAAFHSINAEEELAAILRAEIDKDIVAKIIKLEEVGFETKEEIVSFLRHLVKYSNENDEDSEEYEEFES